MDLYANDGAAERRPMTAQPPPDTSPTPVVRAPKATLVNRLVQVLAGLVVIGTLLFPLFAVPHARAEARRGLGLVGTVSDGASPSAAVGTPSGPGVKSEGLGLTPLPILSPGLRSQITARTAEVLEPLLQERADALGVDLSALRAAATADYDALPGPKLGERSEVSYPYEYPQTRAVLSNVKASTDQLVDFASLLELASTVKSPDGTSGSPHGEAPYEVLLKAREVDASCAVELSIEHLVMMGFDPRDDAIETVTKNAVKACTEDPTAA